MTFKRNILPSILNLFLTTQAVCLYLFEFYFSGYHYAFSFVYINLASPRYILYPQRTTANQARKEKGMGKKGEKDKKTFKNSHPCHISINCYSLNNVPHKKIC
jgi:hypothetical protein